MICHMVETGVYDPEILKRMNLKTKTYGMKIFYMNFFFFQFLFNILNIYMKRLMTHILLFFCLMLVVNKEKTFYYLDKIFNMII